MCKRALLVFLALMTSVCTLTACDGNRRLGDRDMDIYEKIHNYYSKMERYSACLKFTVYSNKTENVYIAEQKSMGNDKFYTKVTGSDSALSVTTITNGEKTKTLTEGSDYTLTVPSADTTGLLFVNRFFAAYYSSEETALMVNGAGRGNVTVLETELSPKQANCAKATLTVNNKTLAPETLTIYDMGGKEVLKGEFSEFSYNDKAVEEAVFSTD